MQALGARGIVRTQLVLYRLVEDLCEQVIIIWIERELGVDRMELPDKRDRVFAIGRCTNTSGTIGSAWALSSSICTLSP